MYKFSQRSTAKLLTCDIKIQRLFNKIITLQDCTIVYGHRSKQEQNALYQIGRTVELDRGIVTNCDGVKTLSNHNYYPSPAVDVMPYPIDWYDIERVTQFAELVLDTASDMRIDLIWGGHWRNFKDYPHYQLRYNKWDI
jgi:peptidoglycan L-alanyl-D-glutamate endopeptidase CwlK